MEGQQDEKRPYAVLNADCLDAMKRMPDNCIDAIVTDPPYGLSNDSGNSVGKIFSEIVFPENADFYAKRFCNGNLPFPSDSISLLDFVNGSIWKESWVAMEKCPIHLNSEISIGQEEIETASISSIRVSYGKLMNELHSFGDKPITNFILYPRNFFESSIGDCFRSCFRETSLGTITVPIIVSGNPCIASFLRTFLPCQSGPIGNIVGFDNNTFCQSHSSSDIMALFGAENRFMLRLNLRNGAADLLPADSTFTFNSFCELIPLPPNVGESSATSCLPPNFQPITFSFINDTTNRTFSFYFHKEIIHFLTKNRTGFMGKNWDHGVPGVEFWKEALRVAKPGAHLLSFGGTRTFHRIACAIEDAGWEIRDCIMYIYGSGFPKSMDISKAIDKKMGAKRAERGGVGDHEGTVDFGMKNRCPKCGKPYFSANPCTCPREDKVAITEEAKKWNGWGTCLKPAYEPVIMARKPLEGTVVDTVLKYGTGGINIDECRVPTDDNLNGGAYCKNGHREKGLYCQDRDAKGSGMFAEGKTCDTEFKQPSGRFPANVIHDGSDEVLELFPGDSETSPARFFYCAKASKSEKGKDNPHPTVKPLELMKYLIKMVAPENSLVLDPFMGSGSTGVAAIQIGRRFLGVEKEKEYFNYAKNRIETALQNNEKKV